MPITAKQRHQLLVADRTRSGGWITAVVEHLLTADPAVTLLDVKAAFRDAGAQAYVIGGDPFEIVLGVSAWRAALERCGVTAAKNWAALADRR